MAGGGPPGPPQQLQCGFHIAGVVHMPVKIDVAAPDRDGGTPHTGRRRDGDLFVQVVLSILRSKVMVSRISGGRRISLPAALSTKAPTLQVSTQGRPLSS